MVTEDRENVNNAAAVDGGVNNAAMREALELCVQDMCRYCRAEARAQGLPQCLEGCETLKKAKAALATAEESSAVGNTAAMREALKPWIAFAEWLLENAGKDKLGEAIRENGTIIRQRMEELRAVLSVPPRNCDTPYNDRVEMYGAFKNWCKAKGHTMEPMLAYDAFEWLLAPATERKGDGK